MGKITFVVEFEDGKEPPVSANLDVAVVREALNELSVDNDDAHAEIIQKMELLTH